MSSQAQVPSSIKRRGERKIKISQIGGSANLGSACSVGFLIFCFYFKDFFLLL